MWVLRISSLYSDVTALPLLNHLRDSSGGLHSLDMVSLSIQMNQYYEGTPIIPEYIQLLEDAQRKAARAGLPVTDQSLVMLASMALLAADTFPRTTTLWEDALGPLINLGTQHDGKECSDLDEKSLTTFGSFNEEGERK